MRAKIVLPDSDKFFFEILQQMGAPAEAIKDLTDSIIEMNNAASIPPNILDWINKELPRYWKKIIDVKKTSRNVVSEVINFYNNIVKLISKMNLPAQLLKLVAASLKEIETTPAMFEPDTLSEKEKKELKKLNGSLPVMKKIHPTIADHNVSLIRALFDCGLFGEVSKTIQKKKLTAAQLTPLMTIFTYIEPYIDTKYATYLIQLYSDAALDIIQTEPPSTKDICQFINTFVRIMPEKLDKIYQILCDLVKSEKINIVFQCVTCIGRIMQECGLGKSGQKVKEAMLAAAGNKNIAVYGAALESMKEVIEKTKFGLSDFKQLLDASTKTDDDLHLRILAQTPSLKDEADNFAAQYLASGQIYPPLTCMLIDFCKKERLRKTIFRSMIEHPDVIKRADFSVYKIGDRTARMMKEAFESDPSPAAMASIAYLYLSIPQQESMPEFLKTAVHEARGNDDLVAALELFAGVPMPESVFAELFDECLSGFSHDDASTDRLLRVLGKWAAATKSLPESAIFERLMAISFTDFPDYFPHFVDTLMERVDGDLIAQLLLKMAGDGVPPMHARWLVSAVFKTIYNDEEAMEQFVSNTLKQLSEDQRERACALLTCAAGVEADFFRLGETFGLCQDISFCLIGEEEKKEEIITACFHPYHSSRRLYAEASRIFNLPISSIVISTNDGLNDNDIPFNYPLTSLPLGTKQKLDFKVRILSKPRKVPEELEVVSQCTFLSILGSSDNIKALYSALTDTSEESQSILILMMLYDPVGGLPRARTPLQHIIGHSIKDILSFVHLPRVFAFALRSIATSGSTIQRSAMDTVINALTDYSFDTVSLAIACQALPCFQCQCDFSKETLQHILLDCGSLLVRNAIVDLISPEIDPQTFIAMLPMTTLKQYRAKTEQFFECIARFPINNEIYASIYRDMEQFEFSHYGDIDQTFIALTKLIPANEEMINLTLERLYRPPTADTLNRPWVHTLESWSAALEFLSEPKVIPHLSKYLEQLPASIEPDGLSDDFTYMGRCGIANEGNTCYISSVLQLLNCIPGITERLLALDVEKLSPMLLALRQILAELRFARGVTLSVRELTDTLPAFNTEIQQDAEEFLMQIYNKVKEGVKGGHIMEPLEGRVTMYKKDGKQVISKEKNTFFNLSFNTQNCSDLYQAMTESFKPQTPDSGDNDSDASASVTLTPVIKKWPDVLALQLMRTCFMIEEERQVKLTHEFQYPVVLQKDLLREITGTDPGFNYQLTGAIVHAGTVEDGHYIAIVEGLDKDWYLCDDHHISYFGLDELPKYSFGGLQGTDEDTPLSEVWTAYLLFYRREDVEYHEAVLPEDLKAHVNELNSSEWPSTVFYSRQFVEFVRTVFEKNPNDDGAFAMAVTVLFKVAVADVSILAEWALSFADFVMQDEQRCLKLFECIEKNIGDSLPSFVGISDEAASELGTLMNSALSHVSSDARPIHCLLKHLKGTSTKRCLSLAYEFILTATRSLKIDWTQEDETLTLIVAYLLDDSAKDGSRPHGRTYFACFQQVCQILADVSETAGATEAVLAMFDQAALAKIAPLGRRCEPFMTLLTNLAGINPSLFQEIAERASSNRDIQSLMLAVSAADLMQVSSEIPDVSLGFMWDVLPHLIFHERDAIRERAVEAAVRLMRQPDSKAAAFFERGLAEENLPRPSFFDGSSVTAYFIGLVPEAVRRADEGCDLECLIGYMSILRHATMLTPKSLLPFVGPLGDLLARGAGGELSHAIAAIIHDVVVFDQSAVELLSDSAVDAILGAAEPTPTELQLVLVFGTRAAGSPLAAGCAAFHLSTPLDAFGARFAAMVEEGLEPGDFDIPAEAPGIANIGLARALWERCPAVQEQLEEYMLSALRFARPVSLYKRVRKVSACLDILRERRPSDLAEVFPGM